MADVTRTFIAVDLPEQARSALGRLRESLGGEPPGLRWTATEQLHLTLAFLGDVPTPRLGRLCDAVAEVAAPFPPFELMLEGLGAFPSPPRARVLWIGVTGDALPSLVELRLAIVRSATRAGSPPADDRFHPHVTLARTRGGRGPAPNLGPVCQRYRDWKAGPMPVASVVTIASELSATGPNHSPLRSAPLVGASP